MGAAKRWKPEKLNAKLLAVRLGLNLSQGGIVEALQAEDKIDRRDISAFERGTREPPLPLLLRYARLAGVAVEVLIDDRLTLPRQRG